MICLSMTQKDAYNNPSKKAHHTNGDSYDHNDDFWNTSLTPLLNRLLSHSYIVCHDGSSSCAIYYKNCLLN